MGMDELEFEDLRIEMVGYIDEFPEHVTLAVRFPDSNGPREQRYQMAKDPETCHLVEDGRRYGDKKCRCSVCCWVMEKPKDYERAPYYCPLCGRKMERDLWGKPKIERV